MSSIKIPYDKKNSIIGEICNPTLILEVLTRFGYQRFRFLLDSGADCTVAPRSMAELLGISLPDVPDTHIIGSTSGEMGVYAAKLRVRIETETFELRCLIAESDEAPFVLGRLDFFELFNVTLDNKNQQIILDSLR